MPVQKARALRNFLAPTHAGAKGPCPTERPLRLPAQKARAPRNSPPHAGAKGPCPAELPAAACRQSDIRQRGKRFRPLRSPLPTKITIYRVKKGRRRIFSPRRPKPGQRRSPKPRPKARAGGTRRSPIRKHAPKPHPKTRAGGTRRSPGAGAESARLPTRSTAPEELSKKGHPADRRHRQKTTRFSSPEGINNRIINQICPQKNRINHQKIFNPFAFGFHFMYLCRRGV